MCTFSYVKFYVDVDIANICSVLLKNRRLNSCSLFDSASFLFFSLSRKNGGTPMQKVQYIMLKVDAEIANICFV